MGDSLIATKLLPSLLLSLGPPLRDEDSAIRHAAEATCALLGSLVSPDDALDLLTPRLQGTSPGGDTWSQRCLAARLLSEFVKGFAATAANDPLIVSAYLMQISAVIALPDLHGHREIELREALLLLTRNVIASFASQIKTDETSQRNLSTGLVFLQGRCPGEPSVVSDAAVAEAKKLAEAIMPTGQNGVADEALYASSHFKSILASICPSIQGVSWEPSSHFKAAFEVLVRECPRAAWENQETILPIIFQQVQPQQMKEKDAMADYVSA